MRNKPNSQYPKTKEDYLKRINSQKAAIKQNGRLKLDNRDNEGQAHRKNNSPDMNRYRGPTETHTAYNQVEKDWNHLQNDNRQPTKRQKKEKEEVILNYYNGQSGSKDKGQNINTKQLRKNQSSPTFGDNNLAMTNQNQDYLKLHEKLNFLQSKIADMKKHVQRKRQEKLALVQSKRKRKEQRENQQQQQQPKQQKQKATNLQQFITQVPEHKELHAFQKDPYSPRHNVYYISEIIKTYRDQRSVGRQHLLTSLHIFKVLENSRFATEEEMLQKQVKLSRREGYEGKKTLVFDLDETLIHCNDSLTPPFDIKLPITFPTGEVIEAGINIRPYAFDILQNLSRHFEIIVFTASHSCYANVVLDYMDPKGELIHHRLFRQHCYQTPEGMYCKDLRVINRQLNKVLLVDNAAYSYAAQPDNGIPILPYYHGKSDYELKALQKYLLGMILTDDVRHVNRATFQLHRYRNYYDEPEQLVQELYFQEEGK